jgi:predicted Zn-dependent protease
MLTIDNVDDAEEMRLSDEAFDILGFTQVYIYEKDFIYIFYLKFYRMKRLIYINVLHL